MSDNTRAPTSEELKEFEFIRVLSEGNQSIIFKDYFTL